MGKFARWNYIFILLLVLVSVVGCKPEGEKKDTSGSYTVTDIQGTTVTIPAKPKSP